MRGANLLRDAISTSSMAPQDKRLFGSINRQILGGQPGDRLGPVGRVDRTADFDLSASHSRLRDPRPPRVRAPLPAADAPAPRSFGLDRERRSEEHTSELPSLMRISYAVFCLNKKKTYPTRNNIAHIHTHTK